MWKTNIKTNRDTINYIIVISNLVIDIHLMAAMIRHLQMGSDADPGSNYYQQKRPRKVKVGEAMLTLLST